MEPHVYIPLILTRWPVASLTQPAKSKPFADHYCKIQKKKIMRLTERTVTTYEKVNLARKFDHYSGNKPIPHVIFQFFHLCWRSHGTAPSAAQRNCRKQNLLLITTINVFFLSISLPGSLIWRAISQKQLPCYPYYPIPLGCSQIDNLRS
jgi:hypothetical protein